MMAGKRIEISIRGVNSLLHADEFLTFQTIVQQAIVDYVAGISFGRKEELTARSKSRFFSQPS